MKILLKKNRDTVMSEIAFDVYERESGEYLGMVRLYNDSAGIPGCWYAVRNGKGTQHTVMSFHAAVRAAAGLAPYRGGN